MLRDRVGVADQEDDHDPTFARATSTVKVLSRTMQRVDVCIVGAGHNGLVTATLLARAGLDVLVLEDKPVIGGACRTEKPFAKAPHLAASTGAYLLGVMQPELIAKLGLDLPLRRRDPHYFLPTTDRGYLLFGSDQAAMKAQFLSFFSEADWRAHERLQEEIGLLRDDLAPSWLAEPMSLEDTADEHVRPVLRDTFIELCRGSVGAYLDRFGFESDLIKAMYAVTDGFAGVDGTWDTPGTGFNFLAHNMCRLPGSDGTWMIVEGGMGTITSKLAEAAQRAGAKIEVNARVEAIEVDGGAVSQVRVAGRDPIACTTVVVNADPFRMIDLVGRDRLPATYVARIDGYARNGTTMKVNLALRALPKFSCLPEDRGQFGPTTHLLPDEQDVMRSLGDSYADAKAGRLPAFPTIEWYFHTPIDPTLSDPEGHQNSALFVQWVPYELTGTTWEAEEAGYVRHLLSICDRFAPGTSDLVVDQFTLTPRGIETHFGITRGHIHHVDNGFGFTDRLPYATPIGGLYSCSVGTHPGGAVSGCGGHNAAQRVLEDLGKL
jgi:phytoene dehydrogenase-like protein